MPLKENISYFYFEHALYYQNLHLLSNFLYSINTPINTNVNVFTKTLSLYNIRDLLTNTHRYTFTFKDLNYSTSLEYMILNLYDLKNRHKYDYPGNKSLHTKENTNL